MFPGLSTLLKNIALKFHVFLLGLHPTEGNGEKYKRNSVLGWRPNSIDNYALVMFPQVKTLFHIYTTKCSL